jgi:hypothetical protein
MPWWLISSDRHFKGSQCLHLQSQAVQDKDDSTLNLSPKKLTWHRIPDDCISVTVHLKHSENGRRGKHLNLLSSFNTRCVFFFFFVTAHINHVRRIAGVDSVGLGAGYDGINLWVETLTATQNKLWHLHFSLPICNLKLYCCMHNTVIWNVTMCGLKEIYRCFVKLISQSSASNKTSVSSTRHHDILFQKAVPNIML